MLIYSNGCSFSINEPHSYADYVAQSLNAELINKGQEGACNRRIIRTTMRDLLEIKSNNVMALIGLAIMGRTELWRNDQPVQDNDGHFINVLPNKNSIVFSNGLIDNPPDVSQHIDADIRDWYKQFIIHQNSESEMTDLLTDIVMLTGFMKSRNIRYRVFNNMQPFINDESIGYDSPFLKSIRQQLELDSSCIDLWNFSFKQYALDKGYIPRDVEQYGIHGHPNTEAHKYFAEFLLTHINNG